MKGTHKNFIFLIIGELERHMEHSGAKMLVTVPPLIPKVQEAEIKVRRLFNRNTSAITTKLFTEE